jgi:hypothetical protein
MRDIDLMSPEKVAAQYGGDKNKIAQAAQMGIINPTVAVMAGMFIDRMRGAAAKEQQPTATVAEEVLARPRAGLRAAQEMPMERGLDSLPVPEDAVPSFEGGGIVAFADGGDIPSYSTGEMIDLSSIRMGKKKHPFEDEVIRNAISRGVDPTRDLEILYRETGGLGMPETATSRAGARGLMQIMPSTAMNPGYGLPNIFDLAKQRGIEFGDQSKESASKLLENPQLNIDFGSRYRAAMQNRFNDPILAAAAYNAGPGAVQRAGNQVPDVAETRKYVEGISPERRNFIERQEAAAKKVQAARREQLGTGTLSPQGPIIPGPSVMEGRDRPTKDFGTEKSPFPSQADIAARQDLFSKFIYGGRPLPGPTVAQQAMKQELDKKAPEVTAKEEVKPKEDAKIKKGDVAGDKLERLLTEREGRLAAQREEDKNLAILAAGLGMMAGKSPYASQNIGAGALKGIEQYAGARKLARQEEEDILAGRLGQYRFGEEGRLRAEDRRLNQGMNLASMEEKRIRDEFGNILGNVLDPRNKQLQELLKRDPDYVNRMAIAGRNRILQGYGIDIGGEMPAGSTIAKDYSNWGKLNVGK